MTESQSQDLLSIYWPNRAPAKTRTDIEDEAIQSWLAAYHNDWETEEDVVLSAFTYEYCPEPPAYSGSGTEVGHYASMTIASSGDDGGWVSESNFSFATDADYISIAENGIMAFQPGGYISFNHANGFLWFGNLPFSSKSRINTAKIIVKLYDSSGHPDRIQAYIRNSGTVYINAHCDGDSSGPTSDNTAENMVKTWTTKEWTLPEGSFGEIVVDTPDIAAVIEEVTRISNYVNSITFLLSSDSAGRAEFYSYDGGYAPELQVWYNETYDEGYPEGLGVVGGGSAESFVSQEYIPSGGALIGYSGTGVACSGESLITQIANIETNGGAVVGCSGTGVLCSGESVVSKLYEQIILGGIYLGGDSSSDLFFVPPISGGCIVSGYNENNATYNTTFIGGAKLRGRAAIEGEEYVDGGIYVSGSSNYNLTTNKETTGGALLGGISIYNAIANSASNSVVIAGGTSVLSSIYVSRMNNGAKLNGTTTVFNVVSRSTSGGILLGGESSNYSEKRITPSGGVVVVSIIDINSIINPTPLNGAKVAGHGATIETEFASGGILAGGQYITRYLVDYPSGGLSIGGQSLAISAHNWIKVDNCESDVKCGYSNDDQFCAGFDKVQGFSSKLSNPKRKDVTALWISKKSSYGTTAYAPAITFCHQKIRVDAEDMPPKRIITSEVPVETINDEDIQLNMMSISMPITGSEIKSIKPKKIVQKNLNTPQMAALKKLSNSTKKTTFIHEPIAKGHKRVQKTQRPRLDAL